MNVDMFLALDALLHRNTGRDRHPRMVRVRLDPVANLSDFEFKRTFRFSKESAQRIERILGDDLKYQSNRGLPLSPMQQICVGLNHFAGAHFQRVSGMCGGLSQNCARGALIRVADALVKRKPDYVKMPTETERQETAYRMFTRFGLPRFAYAVDGTLLKFSEAPRKLPPNKHKQQFWSRKQDYGIQAQVVANDRFILDLDVGWPASAHDSRIWKRSEVKQYLDEEVDDSYIAADQAYPISDYLMKPYTVEEAANDPRKRRFNSKLSGLRTVMSECIYGVWKRRFPILKALRTDFELSQKIIVATAVLFNMARMFGDEFDDIDDDEEEDDDDDDLEDDDHRIQERLGRNDAATRLRGQVERERLVLEMINV